jgi:hypothetical protein
MASIDIFSNYMLDNNLNISSNATKSHIISVMDGYLLPMLNLWENIKRQVSVLLKYKQIFYNNFYSSTISYKIER